MKLPRIALFASGTGSNAVRVIEHFMQYPQHGEVAFVLTNKTDAGIVAEASSRGVSVIHCSNDEIDQPQFLAELCRREGIDYIVLAGFLRKIPADLILDYPEKIINIHPSLLPKYGGKGMYGMHVHRAVLANNEPESGITIHYVNEEFDKGRIIAQFSCQLHADDTAETIQRKVQLLEHTHFAPVIDNEINNR